MGMVDIIDHRGFYRSCAVISAIVVISRHGRENQRIRGAISAMNGR